MRARHRFAAIAAAVFALAACGDPASDFNSAPSFATNLSTASYDGSSDDLLTAGLGWDGLAAANAPATSATPTKAELRKLAIWTNYRALVDMTSAGGYGRLFGPNVSLTGTADTTTGAGKVAGTEYLAYDDDGTHRRNVTMLVQVPNSFDAKNPCIVTATSSGSRGVYGAISAAGEWGLKRGCAVAYTDKGSGNGAHEIDSDTVTLIDGTTSTANSAGNLSHFTAQPGSGTTLASYKAAWPYRYAFKHAHSQQNPESTWGQATLHAISFAYYAINDKFGELKDGKRLNSFKPSNTIVIAASVSNGGGAALAAAEQDTDNLIDAVVVGEPQVNPQSSASLVIKRGGTAVAAFGKPLFDYTTLAYLLQPCAAYATAAAGSPFQSSVTNTLSQPFATNRCAELASAGLISGTSFQAQADDALAKLHAAGWEAESDLLHASMFAFATPAIAVTYANAYAKASVTDNLCGYSFATTNATTGVPEAAATSPMAKIFGNGNGIPPISGVVDLVYNNASGGPVRHSLANNDFAYTGASCLRDLYVNNATVAASVAAIKVSGNLKHKPAIIVHGRSDALVPVNNSSRTYFGLNRIAEGSQSKLSYIEVTNAQHFDAFVAFAGFNDKFIPMHYYNVQALNMMWNHLKNGAALPASQVVRTTPRGTGAPDITTANLPAIATTPSAGDAITFTSNTVNIPN